MKYLIFQFFSMERFAHLVVLVSFPSSCPAETAKSGKTPREKKWEGKKKEEELELNLYDI